jgi:hypothetical protein
VTIQIHSLDLIRDNALVAENVPVVAVWVPARLARAGSPRNRSYSLNVARGRAPNGGPVASLEPDQRGELDATIGEDGRRHGGRPPPRRPTGSRSARRDPGVRSPQRATLACSLFVLSFHTK